MTTLTEINAALKSALDAIEALETRNREFSDLILDTETRLEQLQSAIAKHPELFHNEN